MRALQPSLSNLSDAVDHCVHAGLPTELTTSGGPQLAPGIELTAYRIFSAGPKAGGGYEVRARLPTGTSSDGQVRRGSQPVTTS